ncbi:MAG: FliH/SctL family protein [Patulibacter sp.]|nr:FliH/SctL family protein [Patulibacter sp.]
MSNRFQLPTLEPLRPVETLSPENERALQDRERAAARAEGYAEGKAEAQAEVYEAMANAVAALQHAAVELSERRDALCAAVEPAAISLALQGAEQVVGAALEVQPDLIQHAARGALRRLVDREKVTILVNPDDLETMREVSVELAEQLGGIESLEVQAERRVAPGGVIVQTPVGDVDARVDTRLAQLGDVVRDALAR